MTLLPFLVAGWLFLVALFGVVTSRNMIHLIVCLSVAQASTYVLLLAVGYRRVATAPIFKDQPVGSRAVDPVVQALTLTDVGVGVAVAALLLALALQAKRRHGTLDPEAMAEMRG